MQNVRLGIVPQPQFLIDRKVGAINFGQQTGANNGRCIGVGNGSVNASRQFAARLGLEQIVLQGGSEGLNVQST